MKVAMMGCGTMGRLYAQHLNRMADVSLTGVCASSMESAERFTASHGGIAYASLEDMLYRAAPDVLCITVPTFLHKEYVIRAAPFGIPIICEKPIALDGDDARDMIRICRAHGVELFIGHVLRFFPQYAGLKRGVERGAVGAPRLAHAKRYGPHPGDSWYADSSKSGGVILDLMIHDMDFLHWTLGEVESVHASLRSEEGVEYALVTMRHRNGQCSSLEAVWGYEGAFTTEIEITGEKGVLRYSSDDASSEGSRSASEGAGVVVPGSDATDDPYAVQLRHFISCILHGETPIVTAADALQALELAQAALESAASGVPVRPGGWKDGVFERREWGQDEGSGSVEGPASR